MPGLKDFASQTAECFEFLKCVNPNQLSWTLVWDLLANARRRAELEMKYEDALVRCYSAIEKAAKHELLKSHGIDNSAAAAEQVPDLLRGKFLAKYLALVEDRRGGHVERLQFGAVPSFELLRALDNPMGKRFFALEHGLEHMAGRNRSFLAHGLNATDQETFEALFADALGILNIRRESLPQFPAF